MIFTLTQSRVDASIIILMYAKNSEHVNGNSKQTYGAAYDELPCR